MKKFISVFIASILMTTAFAVEGKLTLADSCGFLYQWKTLPVKGRCPQITNPVTINGTLYCVVKCSHLQSEFTKTGVRRTKEEKTEDIYHPIY